MSKTRKPIYLDDKISIIVPVYNVEKYLEQCLDSIVAQSHKNLEIILIDDGSTDQSGNICDRYANKDNRIKVIHQPNGGAASAKNSGLRIATGNYLAFVDSDDYLESDAYEYMLGMLIKYNADVIQCGFNNVYLDHVQEYVQEYVQIKEVVVFGTETYLERYTLDWTAGLLWDKLYKRSLFDGIRFEEGHRIDDEFFTYQGIMNATQIVHSPRIVYNYRKRKSSVMMSKVSQKQILYDKLDYLQKRRKKITSKFPELQSAFDMHYLNMLIVILKDENSDEPLIKEIKSLIRQYFLSNNKVKVGFKFRIQLLKAQLLSARKKNGCKEKNDIDEQRELYYD